MSHRPRQRSRRSRTTAAALLVAAAGMAVLAAGGWWLFMRDGTSDGAPGTGRTLASYLPPDIHALAVHPTDASVVIFGSHSGMLISRDAGKTWKPIGPSGDAMAIAMPAGSRTAYAAGHDVFLPQ